MGFEVNSLYRFEGFEMDPANRLVTGAGKPLAIPARAFDLLFYMVQNAERLLTKEELMKSVWGDAFVEEGNLTQSVFLLRKALSANQPADNKLIVTVPGRGYRFTAQVEEIAGPGPGTPQISANGNGQPHLPAGISEEPQVSRRRVP